MKTKHTKQELEARFFEGKKLRKKLERNMLKRISRTIKSKAPEHVKVSKIFDEFFEAYHQTKLYWLKKDKKLSNN
jgi:hypothetical protein